MPDSLHPRCSVLPLQPTPAAPWIVITRVAERVGKEEKLRPCYDLPTI